MKIKINKPMFLVVVAMVAMTSSAVLAADAGGKFSGYAVPQLNWWNSGGTALIGSNANGTAGYRQVTVSEAALMWNWEGEGTTVMFDLPYVPGNTAAAGGISSALTQAYVKHAYNNGFWWQLGKFDHWVGNESNDATNRMFLNGGNLVNTFFASANSGSTNLTHTALALGYNMEPIMFSLLLGNGRTTAPGNTSASLGGAEYGFDLKFSSDMFHADGTLLFDKQPTQTPMTIDIIAGMKSGALTGDLEFVTVSGVTAFTSNPMGFGLWVGYGMSSTMDLGLRGDYVLNNGGTSGNTAMTISAGPSFKMTKNLTVKADVDFASLTAGTSTSDFGASVGAVAKF